MHIQHVEDLSPLSEMLLGKVLQASLRFRDSLLTLIVTVRLAFVLSANENGEHHVYVLHLALNNSTTRYKFPLAIEP